MKIKKIEWRNLGSYGNIKQEIDFGEGSKFYHIFGANGTGKSTISHVISFCLYGKIDGKKLGDIPNRINGNAWTRIEFENNGKNIMVERGLAPGLFEVTVGNIKYDQAGKSNIQAYLEEELIGIPFYVFNNTISLSINDFKSFIKMNPEDKRKIIDKIFGFHILNQMRDALKNEIKKIKDDILVIGSKLASTKTSIDRSVQEMEILTKSLEEESKEKLASLNETLSKFIDIQKIHKTKTDEFKSNEQSLSNLLTDASNVLFETRSKFQEVEKKLKLYDLDKCPVCESVLDSDFHISIKEGLLAEKTKYKENLEKAEKNLEDIKSKDRTLKIQKIELQEKGLKIETKVRAILNDIKSIEAKDNDKQVESLKNILKSLNDDKDKLNAENIKKDEINIWLKRLDDVLGEKGVKQMAIKTILPSLNLEISELINEMNLDYQVVFDEEFKAVLYHMGEEIPVQSLSTGEMKKIDFIVLIAIMKLMKLKFSTINLLFLDELFSSVDPEGVHNILKILQKCSKEMGLNIFVINHAPMPHEIFDLKIDVIKTNHFSSINIEVP